MSNATFRCNGKQRFVSFNVASTRASRIAHRSGLKVHAYRCNVCGGFHVGSRVGGRARKPEHVGSVFDRLDGAR